MVVGAAEVKCATCGIRLTSQAYLLTRRGFEQKVAVCPACAKLDTICYLCGLPVKDKGLHLSDGRILCEDDVKSVVLTQDEAERIFDDVKRELQSTLSRFGVLPHYNIRLVLETKARLDKSGANLISAHDDTLLMGLTRTTARADGSFEHVVWLLYGLTRDRMAAVAAHEYGHAWLHENIHRKLNHDTVEGFCDWLAHKFIEPRNASEARILEESNYSQGQAQAFLAAEKEHGFYHVMNWVRNGADAQIDPGNLPRLFVLRDDKSSPAGEPATPAAPVAPRSNPTNLVLKGVSGSATRRFALINDGTFALNEQGRVRLGNSNVVLRCLEIGSDAVLVQVSGENEPRRLFLGLKPVH